MAAVKCAVYVRKSTEHGLEQEFNSLDNQEAACKAYIASQAFNEWEYFKTYSDGGISGGTMERPGLQQMLEDIQTNKIQIVLVYKIDRLSRSIMDFHNMMKVFDKFKCNFVSITQAFDTSTSMGKLTLNMLLSFAQFEREVSSERVRDKIRASKAKGIWTGGIPMLGYDVINKKLVVNEIEAAQVKMIFELYLELNSVTELAIELRARGILNKRWTNIKGKTRGGRIIPSVSLYKFLRNKIYIGILEHKANGTSAKGEHSAIISKELFNTVQERLKENSSGKVGPSYKSANLLTGKLYSTDGTKFANSVSRKNNGKQIIHYYAITGNYINNTNIDSVTATVVSEFMDADLSKMPPEFNLKLKQIDYANMGHANRNNFIKTIVEKAILSDNKLTLFIKTKNLEIDDFIAHSFINQNNKPMKFIIDNETVIIEHDIIITKGKQLTKYNASHKGLMTVTENNHLIVRAFALAHKYKEMYERDGNIHEIMKTEKTSFRNIYRYLSLAYLSPDIVNNVMSGKRKYTVDEMFKMQKQGY